MNVFLPARRWSKFISLSSFLSVDESWEESIKRKPFLTYCAYFLPRLSIFSNHSPLNFSMLYNMIINFFFSFFSTLLFSFMLLFLSFYITFFLFLFPFYVFSPSFFSYALTLRVSLQGNSVSKISCFLFLKKVPM